MSDGTRNVQARQGFFPIVLGDEVSVTQAGSRLIVSRGDLQITEGGAMRVLARGDVKIREGGALVLLSGGDVSIREGGAGVAAAGTVRVDRGHGGFAVGRDVAISNDSTVYFGPREAAVFGAAAGVVCGIVMALLRGRRSRR